MFDVDMPSVDGDILDKISTEPFGVRDKYGSRLNSWEGFQYQHAGKDLGETDAECSWTGCVGMDQTPFSFSTQEYPLFGGHLAVMVPFYSTELLEDINGTAEDHPFQDLVDNNVIRKYYEPEARYRCLRVSPILTGELGMQRLQCS